MPIIQKRSLTPGSIPTTASLAAGELAINVPDGRIFLRRSGSASDTIQSAITTGASNSGSVQLTGSLSISGSGEILTIGGDLMEMTGSLVVSGSQRIIGNLLVTGSILVSGSITGSLFGTASWATNALTASFYGGSVVSSSYALSSSFATFASNALSSSFAISSSNALSASFAPNLYNTSATLTGARTITLGGNTLDIIGSSTSRFFSNGNVGVGTTTDAGFKLDVNGTLRSTTLTLTSTGNSINIPSAGRIHFDNREVAIGEGATATYEGVAIGFYAGASSKGVAIGKNLSTGATSAIMIGGSESGLVALGSDTISIGSSTVSGIGIGGFSNHNRGIAIGSGAQALNAAFEGNVSLGLSSVADGVYAVAIGSYSQANSNEFVVGCRDKPVTNVYFGGGNQSTSRGFGTGTSYAINGSSGYGTDQAGGNITIAGGKGTSAGNPGDVIISTATSGSTGTTLQTLSERVRVKGNSGNLLVGTSVDSGYKLDVNGSARVTSSLYVGTTFQLDQTLTDYFLVSSSIVGANNMFTQATGSYTSAYFKYTVSNGTNARTGEVMTVWNGASVQYNEATTMDIGSTTDVICSVAIVSGDVQFNVQTNSSGWRIKSLATYM